MCDKTNFPVLTSSHFVTSQTYYERPGCNIDRWFTNSIAPIWWIYEYMVITYHCTHKRIRYSRNTTTLRKTGCVYYQCRRKFCCCLMSQGNHINGSLGTQHSANIKNDMPSFDIYGDRPQYFDKVMTKTFIGEQRSLILIIWRSVMCTDKSVIVIGWQNWTYRIISYHISFHIIYILITSCYILWISLDRHR